MNAIDPSISKFGKNLGWMNELQQIVITIVIKYNNIKIYGNPKIENQPDD